MGIFIILGICAICFLDFRHESLGRVNRFIINQICSFLKLYDSSALETRTEFEGQKKHIYELQSRLADAEFKLVEGEMLRKKLHNTILVVLIPQPSISSKYVSLC